MMELERKVTELDQERERLIQELKALEREQGGSADDDGALGVSTWAQRNGLGGNRDMPGSVDPVVAPAADASASGTDLERNGKVGEARGKETGHAVAGRGRRSSLRLAHSAHVSRATGDTAITPASPSQKRDPIQKPVHPSKIQISQPLEAMPTGENGYDPQQRLNELLLACENEVREAKGYVVDNTDPIRVARCRLGEEVPPHGTYLSRPKDTGVDFTLPVDIPEYDKVIKNPISLNQIRTRCRGGKYLKFEDFLEDVRLLARNTRKFNTSPELQWIVQHADLLLEAAEEAVQRRKAALIQAEQDLASGSLLGLEVPVVGSKRKRESGGGVEKSEVLKLGSMIDVFWDDSSRWYPAKVVGVEQGGKVILLYDDDFKQTTNISRVKWRSHASVHATMEHIEDLRAEILGNLESLKESVINELRSLASQLHSPPEPEVSLLDVVHRINAELKDAKDEYNIEIQALREHVMSAMGRRSDSIAPAALTRETTHEHLGRSSMDGLITSEASPECDKVCLKEVGDNPKSSSPVRVNSEDRNHPRRMDGLPEVGSQGKEDGSAGQVHKESHNRENRQCDMISQGHLEVANSHPSSVEFNDSLPSKTENETPAPSDPMVSSGCQPTPSVQVEEDLEVKGALEPSDPGQPGGCLSVHATQPAYESQMLIETQEPAGLEGSSLVAAESDPAPPSSHEPSSRERNGPLVDSGS
uniref:Bromo domain-containing protein n=1 Tax=Compsopogon caeruleus TaxID=31354 RepID=A0A6T6CRB2_9RHOD|mmetsp:Transcript_4534/g.9051  ORF Transcript_4534/g.9051 Transcript_4534/m.9051 type:complete len:703 (+) Transcript_4534:565-2673(+)